MPNLPRNFNMRIARDGTWYYQGSPIERPALVRLFSTVLRRDADGCFWLTTPVENGRIEVEDAPFIAVELAREGSGRDQIVRLRTNVEDWVRLDVEHSLRIQESAEHEPRPYVMVRKDLEARLARSVFYQLVDLGVAADHDRELLGVWSAGTFFPLGRMS